MNACRSLCGPISLPNPACRAGAPHEDHHQGHRRRGGARHTPNQLGDPLPFRVDLLNNSTSPLQITSYSGSDWDTADGTPAVGTTIAKGQEIGVFLYSEGGAMTRCT